MELLTKENFSKTQCLVLGFINGLENNMKGNGKTI